MYVNEKYRTKKNKKGYSCEKIRLGEFAIMSFCRRFEFL